MQSRNSGSFKRARRHVSSDEDKDVEEFIVVSLTPGLDTGYPLHSADDDESHRTTNPRLEISEQSQGLQQRGRQNSGEETDVMVEQARQAMFALQSRRAMFEEKQTDRRMEEQTSQDSTILDVTVESEPNSSCSPLSDRESPRRQRTNRQSDHAPSEGNYDKPAFTKLGPNLESPQISRASSPLLPKPVESTSPIIPPDHGDFRRNSITAPTTFETEQELARPNILHRDDNTLERDLVPEDHRSLEFGAASSTRQATNMSLDQSISDDKLQSYFDSRLKNVPRHYDSLRPVPEYINSEQHLPSSKQETPRPESLHKQTHTPHDEDSTQNVNFKVHPIGIKKRRRRTSNTAANSPPAMSSVRTLESHQAPDDRDSLLPPQGKMTLDLTNETVQGYTPPSAAMLDSQQLSSTLIHARPSAVPEMLPEQMAPLGVGVRFHVSKTLESSVSGHARASNTPIYHHDTINQPTSVQPLDLPRNTSIPPVNFAIDNRAESRLQPAEVQSLIETFTQTVRLVTIRKGVGNGTKVFPVDVVMWQTLPDFYAWYLGMMGGRERTALKFEFVDIQWRPQKLFVLPEDNLESFRVLKQQIWDFFWATSSMKLLPAIFRIFVSTLLPSIDGVGAGDSQPPKWTPVNSNLVSPPGESSSMAPSSQDAMTKRYPRAAAFATAKVKSKPLIDLTLEPHTVTDMAEAKVSTRRPDHRHHELMPQQQSSVSNSGSKGEAKPFTHAGSNNSRALSPRMTSSLSQSPQWPQPSPNAKHPERKYYYSNMHTFITTGITIRLQISETGKFSMPYDKGVLNPRITNMEFFAWFAGQTGYGDANGPVQLKFTFKDAMPSPKLNVISRGNDEHFNYMRRDIKDQLEKAKTYMPDLKDFAILVTVPGWGFSEVEEEDL